MELNRSVLSSKVLLCDIEGTTSSIDFVKETLFPYALKNVEKFLQDNWDRDDVKEAVVELRKLAEKDAEEKTEGAVLVLGDDEDKAKVQESVVKSVEWLMGNDRKVTPLKALQGLIWEAGYKDGSIKSHVYDDVPKAFENWTKTGHKIFIYSSGSVMAQKLLFGNTSAGDLMSHLSGYFDTKIGAKQDKESYEAIAKEVECVAGEILFLTDVVKEAKAAQEAGMNVVIVNRPGNAALTDEEKKEFAVVDNFEALPLEEVTTGKRKIPEEEAKQETTKPAKVAKLETDVADAAEKPEQVSDEKTDDEPKCDTAVVDKIEIERTDDEKTEKETESKAEDKEEKMETDESEEVKDKVEDAEEAAKVEEKKEEAEQMEVDGKGTTVAAEVESVAAVVAEVKEPAAAPTTEEAPAEEKKKEEEVVNGKSVEGEKVEEVAAEEEKKETPVEEEKKEKVVETEKVVESTNGDAVDAAPAEEVNGGNKAAEVAEEKAENGKDEVKNGHNENADSVVAATAEVTADSTASPASGASDQATSSEVIVKKCVEPMVKSPVAQPVEAAES